MSTKRLARSKHSGNGYATPSQYRSLGVGTHTETICLLYDIVTLHHPIKLADFLNSLAFSREDIQAISRYLAKKIDWLESDPLMMSHEELEVQAARRNSYAELRQLLADEVTMPGSFPPDVPGHDVVAARRNTEVSGSSRRFRRIYMGGNVGNGAEDIILPNSNSDYVFKINHPLIEEDIRVAVADFDSLTQQWIVEQLTKALQRRSTAQIMEMHSEYPWEMVQNFLRVQSIDSLWEVYMSLFEDATRLEVVQYLNQPETKSTGDHHISVQRSVGYARTFFMFPIHSFWGIARPVAAGPLLKKPVMATEAQPTNSTRRAKSDESVVTDSDCQGAPMGSDGQPHRTTVTNLIHGNISNPFSRSLRRLDPQTPGMQRENSHDGNIPETQNIIKPVDTTHSGSSSPLLPFPPFSDVHLQDMQHENSDTDVFGFQSEVTNIPNRHPRSRGSISLSPEEQRSQKKSTNEVRNTDEVQSFSPEPKIPQLPKMVCFSEDSHSGASNIINTCSEQKASHRLRSPGLVLGKQPAISKKSESSSPKSGGKAKLEKRKGLGEFKKLFRKSINQKSRDDHQLVMNQVKVFFDKTAIPTSNSLEFGGETHDGVHVPASTIVHPVRSVSDVTSYAPLPQSQSRLCNVAQNRRDVHSPPQPPIDVPQTMPQHCSSFPIDVAASYPDQIWLGGVQQTSSDAPIRVNPLDSWFTLCDNIRRRRIGSPTTCL